MLGLKNGINRWQDQKMLTQGLWILHVCLKVDTAVSLMLCVDAVFKLTCNYYDDYI